MRNAPVPPCRRCRRTVAIGRSLPVAVLLVSLFGTAACGSEDEPVSGVPARAPACQRLERLFADVRAGAQPHDAVDEARAVLAALRDPAPRGLRGVAPGGRVPRSLAGPASVLARAGSAPEEDVEGALGDVARWFGAQCVGPTTLEGPEDRRLLPSPPPADLPLCLALDTEALVLGRPTPPAPDAADWAIWGDASAPDPWAATVVWLQTARTDRVPVHDDATPAAVGGRPALVAPAPLFQAVSSAAWGHIVSWRARPGLVAEVAVRRGSPMEALRVAELVRFDGARPSLPDDALGPRTEALFNGIPPSPLGIDAQALWWVVYGRQQIRVLGHAPVDRDALRALEFWTVHSEPRTIRGQPGILYAAFDADTGPWGVAWMEPDGLLVQVVGFAPQEAVVELASSLVDVSPAEWRAAKTAAEPCEDDTP